MPAYYRAPLHEFVKESASSILGKLAVANGDARFPLAPEAIEAWRLQLPILMNGCAELIAAVRTAADYELLLEYPIPRVGKRIDAVLLMNDVIVAIETKTGHAPTTAERQVDDYAIYLACFHEPSAGRTIVPLVISDGRIAGGGARPFADEVIRPCRIAPTDNVGRTLISIEHDNCVSDAEPVNADEWNRGRFRPIPPIIEAAVKLYSDMQVFEIGHACAAQEDLDRATNALVEAVTKARTNGTKLICFVTGVPGAGKTLVGLNAVHSKELRGYSSFLSANGPLVKIIREALIRDVTQQSRKTARPITRRKAEISVQTFVQSVHRFAETHYGKDDPVPHDRVIIFDEAQRAWDAEQNRRKKRPEVSEAHMMLEVMSRHEGWAVLVCLIGGGQEINSGEAGLAEWGSALRSFEKWQIYASPEILAQKSESPFLLFREEDPYPARIRGVDQFHLKVNNRSIRAQHISEWVDAVLRGDPNVAKQIASEMLYPPVLTRKLSTVRAWLQGKRRGFTRAGLVASASASRLRADGLETAFGFHRDFEWERWFLDRDTCDETGCDHKYCHDVRASSKLEVAATQFEVQGLELDWTGLCWGEDLVWTRDQWASFNFSGKHWKPNNNKRKHHFRINGYRVLLTRARQGMILYVPEPSLEDSSRLHNELDSTMGFLIACGLQEAELTVPAEAASRS
jgi:hypothetical protein